MSDIDEVEVTPAQPEVRPPLRACQIGGVPTVHTIVLTPIHLTDGLYPCLNPMTGLYVGTSVRNSGRIGFVSPVVPDMRFRNVRFVVELTDMDDIPEETMCVLHMVYLDMHGKARELYTPPLVACGDKYTFTIPGHHLRKEHVIAVSLKVTLMSELNAVDETGEYRTHRPVLIRGAWLEFPE